VTLGVGLFGTEPVASTVELTRLCEQLGFANAWFGDSQNMWREAYVTLGAAAISTSRITLGTGVTNAVTRHPSVLACAWASVAELAPGRAVFAIGTGDSSLRSMGIVPPTVVELEQRIEELRRLLAGEKVTSRETGASYRLGFAPAGPVPIYVAAASPRSLRMAGRAADGVIACVGLDPRMVEAALAHVETGARQAGRAAPVPIVLWSAVSIADDGAAARDLVRTFTASAVVPPLVGTLDAPELEAVASIRASYDYREHMDTGADHRALVPDGLVARFALAGTPAECRDQLEPILSYPIDQLALVPFAAHPHERGLVLRRLCDEVLPGLPVAHPSRAPRRDVHQEQEITR
jgi:5,10-methylenetetrahydromethanopterin reductase